MKRNLLIGSMFLVAASFAGAQIYGTGTGQAGALTTDVLGAHLNYGRGCTGCHAPHSGAAGNGANVKNATDSGGYALWGQDVGGLEGTTLAFGDNGKYSVALPDLTAGTPLAQDVLTCLSCHDGNVAKGAMMTGTIYETVPGTYGKGTIPTFLGNDGTAAGNYNNDHPVGTAATYGCGGSYNWDCTLTYSTSTSGAISPVITPGPNMSAFISNYGFFVSLASSGAATAPYVVCTSCHNQHSMNVVKVNQAASGVIGTGATSTGQSGLPTGYYATMFFIRAPYNPASKTTGSNQVAQFCRQCHGGESNEMNGSSATTTF